MKCIVNFTHIETPIGTVIACAADKGICMLEFSDRKILDKELRDISKSLNADLVEEENKYFEPLRNQLTEYFQGTLKKFDIPLIMIGTDFQKTVWSQLRKIPYGTTVSYLKEAEAINKPSAVRAVANANGCNKISIIIPCHRVIGSNGTLTGYGGGLWRKEKLLKLEGVLK